MQPFTDRGEDTFKSSRARFNVVTKTPGKNDFPDMIMSSSSADDSDDDDDVLETPLTESEEPPMERRSRVRFRSRVRITSGLNRRRHHHHHSKILTGDRDPSYMSFSPSSSFSGSPSSSISAPLRSHADDEIGKPGWGTLGQRVALLAHGGASRKKTRDNRDTASNAKNSEISERSPLMTRCQLHGEQEYDFDQDEGARLAREIDQVFGPWPGRLLNHNVSLKISR